MKLKGLNFKYVENLRAQVKWKIVLHELSTLKLSIFSYYLKLVNLLNSELKLFEFYEKMQKLLNILS